MHSCPHPGGTPLALTTATRSCCQEDLNPGSVRCPANALGCPALPPSTWLQSCPAADTKKAAGRSGGNGGSSLPGPGPATQLALHREEAEEQSVPRPGGLGCREVPFPCEEADESSSPYSSSDSGSLSNPTSPQSSRAPSASAISNTARAATVGYTAGRVADPDWCDAGEDRASDSGSDLTADLQLPFPTYEYGGQQRTQRRASSSCDSASNYQLCYVNVAAASHLFENGNGTGSALYDYPDFRANAAAHDGSGSEAATTTDSYTYGSAYPTAGLGRERYDSGAEDADDCDEDPEDGEEEDAGQGSNIGLVHRSGDSGSGSPWHGSALQRLASTPAPLNYLDTSSLPQAHSPGSGALLTRLRSLPEPLLPSSSSVSSLDLAPDPAAQPRSRGPRRMGVASSHPLPVSELHGSRGYEDGPGRGQGPASRQGLAGSGLSASRQEEYRLPFQQLGGSYIDAAPQLPPSSSSFSAASRGLGQPGGLYWQHGGSSAQGMGQGLAAGGGAAGHGWWGGQPPLAPSGSGGMGGRAAATPMFGKHTNGRGGSNSRSNSPGQPDSPSSPSALHQGLREVPSVELFSGRYPSKTTRTLMADPGFVQQLLAGLPGVDPAHPAVAAVLAGLAGRSVLVGPLGPLPPPARPVMGGDGLGEESMAGMASGEG
ncbi:hypothetical protein HaLaN_00299 [Haematococcus lacustris]|uniref:Uncharacterized protein n=1 Tax=Haematococcus lacustris TaxID=44745 RepID=A0A699YD48_HAELA|nr:hypothetical protein HaLaN_00299 [Haematococcus lacustris]